MYRLRRVCLLAIGLMVASTLASTRPAFAEQPSTEALVVVNLAGLIPPEENLCPFDITLLNTGTFFITTYYDHSGTPERVLVRTPQLLVTYTANGKTLTSMSPAAAHLDLETGLVTFTGKQFMFRDATGSVVLAAAGRFVFTADLQTLVSVHGLNRAVCEALEP